MIAQKLHNNIIVTIIFEKGVYISIHNKILCTTVTVTIALAKHIEGVVGFLLGVYVDLYDPTNGQDTPPLLQTILAVRVNGIGKLRKCQRPVTMATRSHMTTRLMMVGEVATRMGAVEGGGGGGGEGSMC